ncbi:phage GP46 family protein [Acetobacter estunensis]|uniref:phage GP46 family protein n=1 Tax=Acetobacter estunensis TaxID=104097 RepID=UPI001C2CE1C4|nr:phage GP46 family protein [Acetobacter estunensis]MBV1835663.1 phage GP46 family protein [Acetobacter estunensis]MBV1836076.1 phage GP46 family protein [Acetobacter estunensis]
MDIAIVWNVAQARGDWPIVSGDLGLDNPLRSAVMVSLFTDRVAPDQPSAQDAAVGIQAPGNAATSAMSDRRGWWGDAYADRPIGSRLWQLRRAIKAGETAVLLELEQIVRESLQWLIDDGIVDTITVTTAWSATSASTAEFAVSLLEPGAAQPQTFLFSWAWEGL